MFSLFKKNRIIDTQLSHAEIIDKLASVRYLDEFNIGGELIIKNLNEKHYIMYYLLHKPISLPTVNYGPAKKLLVKEYKKRTTIEVATRPKPMSYFYLILFALPIPILATMEQPMGMLTLPVSIFFVDLVFLYFSFKENKALEKTIKKLFCVPET